MGDVDFVADHRGFLLAQLGSAPSLLFSPGAELGRREYRSKPGGAGRAAPHSIIWLIGKVVRSYTRDLDADAARIH